MRKSSRDAQDKSLSAFRIDLKRAVLPKATYQSPVLYTNAKPTLPVINGDLRLLDTLKQNLLIRG